MKAHYDDELYVRAIELATDLRFGSDKERWPKNVLEQAKHLKIYHQSMYQEALVTVRALSIMYLTLRMKETA